LVKDGRYAEPNIPQGVYAELRVARKIRDLLSVDLQAVQGQIHNWIDRYFPEFLTVFKDWEGKSAIQLLKLNLLPHELVNLSEQEILVHLRKAVKRAVGLSKINELKQVAMVSIGIREGSDMAKLELRTLIDKYELIIEKFEELESNIDQLLEHIPGVEQMLATKGIGKDTVAGFFSEVGDLSHKNKAFKALHEYFTKRPNNPLKKMQSLIAICNKLIRILFTIGKKQCEFSEERMLRDIPHMAELQIAA
jgi:hypothetical protein